MNEWKEVLRDQNTEALSFSQKLSIVGLKQDTVEMKVRKWSFEDIIEIKQFRFHNQLHVVGKIPANDVFRVSGLVNSWHVLAGYSRREDFNM